MGFLRRLLGGSDGDAREADADGSDPASSSNASGRRADAVTLDEEERAHELELARFEQDRTDDLVRRQQRYADRSWTPPAQGGPSRADDGDAPGEG
jgi:hypothetical protein